MSTEVIRVVTTVPAEVVRAMEGCHPDESHYDPKRLVGDRSADVLKPDGSLLLAYRKEALPSAAARLAYDDFLRAATPTDRRVVAAGGTRPNGRGRVIRSGVMGFLHGEPAGVTREGRVGWRNVLPLLLGVDAVFRRDCPAQHAVLRSAADRVPPGLVVPGTAFTTVTVNRTARMAVHRDKGNLPGGYGALTVVEVGDYSGGLLVFPRFRVAVDLRSCDVLVADTHEHHGNTALAGPRGGYERVSVVCYVHASMVR